MDGLNVAKTLYLDSFVYAHIAKDPALAQNVRETILSDGFTLVVSTINLIEFLPHIKRLDAVTEFIASVPFAIAYNVDQLVDEEVRSYPTLMRMPLGFVSSETAFTNEELGNAIQENLVGKIQGFRDGYLKKAEETFEELLRKRDSGKAAFTNSDEINLFLMTNVLAMLLGSHPRFANEHVGNGLNIEHFKVYSIQVLILFEDYYQQKKQGQPSDIGDILQIGYAPYVDLAVFDKAKIDTLRRLAKRNVLPAMTCQNLSEFRRAVATS
jgi:hypothetical protein